MSGVVSVQLMPPIQEDSASLQASENLAQVSKNYESWFVPVYCSGIGSLTAGSLSAGVSIWKLASGASKVVFGAYGAAGLVEFGLGVRSIYLVCPKIKPMSRTDLVVAGMSAAMSAASIGLAWFCGEEYV